MTDNPNSDAVFTTRENAALWIQPGGPNTPPFYLGCHDLGDISAPEGGTTLIQCFDGRGGWRTLGETVAPPEPITFSLGTYLGKTRDWIERVRCPAPLYVMLRDCGRPDLFGNFVRALILDLRRITTRTYTGLVNKSEDQTAMVNVDAEAAPPLLHAFTLTPVRQSIAETADLHGVAVCGDGQCAGPCGGQSYAGDDVVIAGEALTGSPTNPADVWITDDAGANWDVAADQPFAGGEDAGPIACFQVGRATTRILVARMETDAGAPAEVAYSDDNGVTWTNVNVGSLNGQYAKRPTALFALDYSHVWLAATDGYIYFSSDGGETWSAQEEGVITNEDLNAVHFLDERHGYVGGDNNVALRTNDGGATWEAVIGPAVGVNLNAVWATPDGRVWVGDAGGNLWFSNDRGADWTQRAFTGHGAGAVVAVKFANAFVGFLLHNTAAPVGHVLVTINGGYTWERLTLVGNAGLNGLAVASELLAYAVGNVNGGTSVVLKIAGG